MDLNYDINLVKKLKCVCCGAYDDLEIYDHIITSKVLVSTSGYMSKYSKASKKFNVPTCHDCNQGFTRYEDSSFRWGMIFLALPFIFLTVYYLPFIKKNQDMDTIFWSFIMLPILVVVVLVFITFRRNKYRVSRYIRASWDELIIKDFNTKRWVGFNEWAAKIAGDRYGVMLEGMEPKMRNGYLFSTSLGDLILIIGLICLIINGIINFPLLSDFVILGVGLVISGVGLWLININVRNVKAVEKKTRLLSITYGLIFINGFLLIGLSLSMFIIQSFIGFSHSYYFFVFIQGAIFSSILAIEGIIFIFKGYSFKKY